MPDTRFRVFKHVYPQGAHAVALNNWRRIFKVHTVDLTLDELLVYTFWETDRVDNKS